MSSTDDSLAWSSFFFSQLIQLKSDGSNWAEYKYRLLLVAGCIRGVASHIEGQVSPRPSHLKWDKETRTYVRADGDDQAVVTDEEIKEFVDKTGAYDQLEAIALLLMHTTIPPYLQLQARKLQDEQDDIQPTSAKTFAMLQALHEGDGENYNLSLEIGLLSRQLYTTKCGEDADADLGQHLDTLCDIRNKLARLGHAIDDRHFSGILTISMPSSIRPGFETLFNRSGSAGAGDGESAAGRMTAVGFMARIRDLDSFRKGRVQESGRTPNDSPDARPSRGNRGGRGRGRGREGERGAYHRGD